MTAIFFMTYYTKDYGTGHCMSRWEYDENENIENAFFDWCNKRLKKIEDENSTEAIITSINLIK